MIPSWLGQKRCFSQEQIMIKIVLKMKKKIEENWTIFWNWNCIFRKNIWFWINSKLILRRWNSLFLITILNLTLDSRSYYSYIYSNHPSIYRAFREPEGWIYIYEREDLQETNKKQLKGFRQFVVRCKIQNKNRYLVVVVVSIVLN